MWIKLTKPHEGDRLGRDHWFILRTESAQNGLTALVMVDWAPGTRPDVTRAEMPAEDAQATAEETVAALSADGWIRQERSGLPSECATV